MKKLLIAMMSVASLAFISKADAINSGTTFENYTGAFGADKDDTGHNDGTFWYTAGSQSDCGTLTNTDYTASYTGEVPAIHTTETDDTPTALAVEAEQRLERGIANYSGGFAPQDIGSGIYFDTMVQFTATDTAPTKAADNKDKLIVWLYGSAEEDGAFGIGTNLVVTAGYLGTGNADVTLKHYLNTNESIVVEPNSWHRLTIKAISDIGASTSRVAGFVVFIDGVAVTSTEDKANADANTVFKNLSSVGAKWNTLNALFPSLVAAGDNNCQSLSAVALEGTGMIDDISFTSDAPRFAKDDTVFTLKWDDGVDTLSYSVNDGAAITVDTSLAAQAVDITIERAGTTVAVAATYKSGYQAGAWTTSNASATLNGTTWTVADVSVGTVVSQQALFEVNGMAYATFADALKAIGDNGTIKVLADVDMSAGAAKADQYINVEEGKVIILDLNGKNMVVGGTKMKTTGIDVYGRLVITNSSMTVGSIIPYMAAQGPITAITATADEEVGTVIVYDRCKIEGTIDLSDGGVASLVGGIFYDEGYEEGGSFYLNSCVASGSAATYSGDQYFTVAPGEPTPPPATKWTVTVAETLPAHVLSVTATPNEVSEDAESKTVKLSATFDEGYELDHFVVEGEAIEGNTFTISANVVVSAVAKQTIVPVTSVTLDKETAELTVGGALELTATVNPENATDKTVTWTSSDTEKATVVDGRVVAVAAGEVTITATAGEKTASCVVTVKAVTPEKTYPNYIPADASEEVKAKFDAWAAAYGTRDDESANEAAYLLNVAPADAEKEAAKFAITAITVGGGVVVTVPSQNSAGKAFNGTVEIKGKAALTDADWATVDYTTHHFFKAFLK